MKWVGYVARVGEMTNAYNISVRKSEDSEDIGVDGSILELVLGKLGGKLWTGFIWLRIGTSGGLL
jgi:hypothetical protein